MEDIDAQLIMLNFWKSAYLIQLSFVFFIIYRLFCTHIDPMRRVFFILFLLTYLSGSGQSSPLEIQKGEKGLFVQHKVAPKENWYSVGRLYFLSPRDIASFNNLTIEKGLGIGQTLKIPISSANFSSSASAGIPVVYKVKQKEGLLKIANEYGIEIGQLRKLNELNSDNLKIGTSLVIGRLTSGGTSAHQSSISSTISVVSSSASASASQEVPQKPAVSTTTQSQYSYRSPSGYFLNSFQQQATVGKEHQLENPAYGIFKSSSGWQDGKYYVLMNGVLPGTIVKLSSNRTDKIVYAKVLGAVPQGKESEGLILRISNATASILGVETEGKISLVWYN